MDNNFNQQQAPVQPTYQQAPTQPMYQQAPAQPMYQQAPKRPSKVNIKELIGLICSGVGTFMAVLGSILTCSCSASKTWDSENLGTINLKNLELHSTSLVCLVAIIGAMVAVTGVVFAILALKEKNANVKAGKMSYIAIAVGIFGVMYGILPVLTICGYNCSLNSNYTSLFNY